MDNLFLPGQSRAGGAALALVVDNLANERLEIGMHSRENSVNKEKAMPRGRFWVS
jgi:hypothetical protein